MGLPLAGTTGFILAIVLGWIFPTWLLLLMALFAVCVIVMVLGRQT